MDTRGKSFNKSKVGEREYEIEYLLNKNGKMSRRQLALELGVESNSVTAAAQNLLNKGKIIEAGEVYDQETKRHQKMLAINPEPVNVKKTNKVNKDWKISSLELENQTLKRRLDLMVHMFKYFSSRDSGVGELAKDFFEAHIKASNETK